ncbi:RNA polymerase factor sigma-54 [Chlamydiifrater phoenicopteri]|uniref:RNA polymerase factor sigma-54 n=1 Tax=Chlamydiifrater phoenicopteri TaxID=2681469 RepID=UPI001BCF6C5F|nr:RNA polymerase factor sigma-54 [Chlamydiifrater phoenicopteri]
MLHQDLQVSATHALSQELQQSLKVLEAPIDELSQLVIQQIIANPVFDLTSLDLEEDFDSSPKDLGLFPDHFFSEEISPLHLLNRQIEASFSSEAERLIAQFIVGSLDDHGFLSSSIEELAVLTDQSEQKVSTVLDKIKQFSPLGVASFNLREHWLLQLKHLEFPLIYQAVKDYYPLLVDCEFATIAKKLSVPIEDFSLSLREAFRKISWAPFSNLKHPRASLRLPPPDIYLQRQEGQWLINVNKKGLPELKLDMEILKLFRETNFGCCSKEISAAKHLLKSIKKREQTLIILMQKILPIQEAFLLGKKDYPSLCPPKEIAEEAGYHVSTIFRAIENKTVSCPIGIIPLKNLFPSNKNRLHTLQNSSIHSEKAKDAIRKIIAKEPIPLSDEAISEHLLKMGIVCARRTVSKYRKLLQILPASKRKQRLMFKK